MKRLISSLLLSAFLVPMLYAATDSNDRVIEPTQRVGAVTSTSTEANLLKVYGSKNVRTTQDGMSLVIFPGKPDEVKVEFKSIRRSPARVVIAGRNGAWTTASGLRVGLPIAELEKINGASFDVTGVNWSTPARVVSWKGGALPPQLYVDLGTDADLDKATRKSLMSKKTFYDSDNPVFKDFYVKRIVLEW